MTDTTRTTPPELLATVLARTMRVLAERRGLLEGRPERRRGEAHQVRAARGVERQPRQHRDLERVP